MPPDPNQNFKGKSSSIEDEAILEVPTFQNITNSSSEEENELENNGYEPLPQDPDSLEEDQIDYSSLSGVMNALNTYGPHYINISEENNQSLVQELLPCVENDCPDLTDSKFQAGEIIIDREKEEEIKNVMSKITLPTSAIPLWASQLSDEEWKSHVNLIICGGGKKAKDE